MFSLQTEKKVFFFFFFRQGFTETPAAAIGNENKQVPRLLPLEKNCSGIPWRYSG